MTTKTQIASADRLPCGGTPYEDVARVLWDNLKGPTDTALIRRIAHDFITLFAFNNPDFNRTKFLAQCELKEKD